ncbi:MAG: hypothetical protein HN348_22630, partial [Proteobacteria bacterium]|nr:hypothetical protein [Pseudomonadota bacterium]
MNSIILLLAFGCAGTPEPAVTTVNIEVPFAGVSLSIDGAVLDECELTATKCEIEASADAKLIEASADGWLFVPQEIESEVDWFGVDENRNSKGEYGAAIDGKYRDTITGKARTLESIVEDDGVRIDGYWAETWLKGNDFLGGSNPDIDSHIFGTVSTDRATIDQTTFIECCIDYEVTLELETEDKPFVDTYTELAGSDTVTCGITTQGYPRCWGQPEAAYATEVGLKGDRLVVAADTACMVYESEWGDKVKCWGNSNAQVTNPSDKILAHALSDTIHCVIDDTDTMVCMGAIKETTTGGFVDVAVTRDSVCTLDDAGEILCLGTLAGQEPAGVHTALAGGGGQFCALSASEAVCWGDVSGA